MPGKVMNLGCLLSQTAWRLPDRTALVWRDASWTWAELNARVDALAGALRQRGVGKGDPVLVMGRNSNQLFETMWASFKLGAVWVPCNFRLTPPEIAYIAGSSEAGLMVADEDFAEHTERARDEGDVATVITIGEERLDSPAYEDVLADGGGAPFPEAEVAYDDACWFFYTSGTTGRPKAAVLTHGQLAFVTNNHLADLMPGTGPEDASLVVAPLSHGAGAHALSQVAKGAKSVLTDGRALDPEEVWRLVAEHRITNMFTVPLILTRLVRDGAVDRSDHSSLRYVIYAGAPMYRADQSLALEKLGKVIVQYYGLGEVTGNITVLMREDHDLDDAKMPVGSCGYARTGMEVAILGDNGERLAAEEQGEICVRGLAVFAGYLNDDEANSKAFAGGWFHTGDLGYLDAAGYLYITGRASDMYISGGANVYPREAEELLLTHPTVSEVAVLGMPDAQWGESGVAVVVPSDGPPAEPAALEAELLAYLQDRLAKYKQPRRVFFWDSLPASGYGKVPKHEVRRLLYARGDLQVTAGLEDDKADMGKL